MDEGAAFRYLNLNNAWPLFDRDGLRVGSNGELTLARVPALETVLGETLSPVAGLDGPVGIDVDAQGTIYLADPATHQILRLEGCDGSVAPLAGLRGPGQWPGQLNSPRGVLVGPRGLLYVADSGNHRVQVVDPRTGQLLGIWGQPDPWAAPSASGQSGRFQQPWGLASDHAGRVYVADPGVEGAAGLWSGGRVQKFGADGRLIGGFTTTLEVQSQRPGAPAGVAIALLDGEDPASERLLVLDRQPARLLVYALDGALDAAATERWSGVAGQLALLATRPRPVGVVYSDGFLYVADAASGRLLVFDAQGTFVGLVPGVEGTVGGLAVDCQERLLVYPGGEGAVRRFQPGMGYVEEGSFLAGPFHAADPTTRWHRLTADGDLPPGTHLQLFILGTDSPAPPERPWQSPALPWQAAPPDILDLLVQAQSGRALWIAGRLYGDGVSSPCLHQARLEYDHDGWLRYLPAIYRRDDQSRAFLERALALFESLLDTEGRLIDDLPRLFDPWAAPDDGAPRSWLNWLAGWLDFDLDESWEPDQRRAALAEAFTLHARRGTVEGLQRYIKLYSGVTPRVYEPASDVSLWSLGETSVLGFTTVLASAEAQGTVVGTTAVLDGSHLIHDADYGAPLLDDLAHRFCVQVYAAELRTPGALESVRRVVDREKPAHTSYHLCVIEPRLVVGFQARLGIDAIVGGPPPDLVLDEPRRLGVDSVLPEAVGPPGGSRIGEGARLGWRSTLV